MGFNWVAVFEFNHGHGVLQKKKPCLTIWLNRVFVLKIQNTISVRFPNHHHGYGVVLGLFLALFQAAFLSISSGRARGICHRGLNRFDSRKWLGAFFRGTRLADGAWLPMLAARKTVLCVAAQSARLSICFRIALWRCRWVWECWSVVLVWHGL